MMAAERGSWRKWIDLVASLAMIVAATVLIWQGYRPKKTGPPPTPIPTEALTLEGAATEGSKSAHVAIIEYADFQCPYCQSFARDTLPQLQTAYVDAGLAVFAFRHFPLPNHPFAERAAVIGSCAGEQNLFWEAYRFLFAEELSPARMADAAATVGLNTREMEKCVEGQVLDRVRADAMAGNALRITGTPTFFVGTIQSNNTVRVRKTIDGNKPFGAFKTAIDDVLSARLP